MVAYGPLEAARPLTSTELEPFTVEDIAQEQGRVGVTASRALLSKAMRTIDPRLERVTAQQYVRLSVLRRDVTYAMCGTTGTVVLSGKALLGARTDAAVRPIRVRLVVWAVLAALTVVGVLFLYQHLRGVASYFNGTNRLLSILTMVGVALAVPTVGAVLRTIGAPAGGRRMTLLEKCVAGLAAVACLAMPAVRWHATPHLDEVKGALAARDVRRAREVIDAIKETSVHGPDVTEAEDSVAMAEADGATGEARLGVLDQVASRTGTRAAEAARIARQERLAEIRRLIDARDPSRALSAIDRWYGGTWQADSELSEERARAFDVAAVLCGDAVCRMGALAEAVSARKTDLRDQQLAAGRQALLDALAVRDRTDDDLRDLTNLRGLMVLASQAVDKFPTDAEIVAKGKEASAWAQAERSKVSILGSEEAVAAELLGTTASPQKEVSALVVEEMLVYLTLDAKRRVKGVYAVGAKREARRLRGSTWTPTRLLSQAVGRAVDVRKPGKPTERVSKWSEGKISIVARWRSGELVELRIGDAKP